MIMMLERLKRFETLKILLWSQRRPKPAGRVQHAGEEKLESTSAAGCSWFSVFVVYSRTFYCDMETFLFADVNSECIGPSAAGLLIKPAAASMQVPVLSQLKT